MAEKQVSNMNLNAPKEKNDSDAPRVARDEEIDSKSGSDNSYVNHADNEHLKQKRYHRHTQHQIQEMEAFFKECPHPDDRQRRELSRELGMEPLQVKFWFQNKRTQMKTQHEHHENTQLRAENEKLRAENLRYREALSNASCPCCGGPTPIGETSFQEHQLRVENARLQKEIEQISTLATKYVGKPFASFTDIPSSSTRCQVNPTPIVNNLVQNQRYKQLIELAVAAMEELIRMAQLGEPLWVPSIDRNCTVLNEGEYLRTFSRVFDTKLTGYKFEASRESVVLAMDPANVVEILMDVEKWSNVFSGVVAQGTNLQVISPGEGGTYNEALQVMNAEFHVLSPLVPTRDSYFLRYCKRHVDSSWVVVDVSLDHVQSTPKVKCRRRPSGCIIQDMPNGYSKIIWVEHVEVQEGGIHSIYKPLINAGLAFGAKRWVAILDGQCQRITRIALAKNSSSNAGFTVNQEGRKSMLKVAERMVTRFCSGVSASLTNSWTALLGNDADNVKTMMRQNFKDLAIPFGVQLCVATSFWLSIPPRRVFDYLRNQNNRAEWDMLSNGIEVEEIVHIPTGNDACNRISIFQPKATPPTQAKTIMLQESRSDPTASYVVYAAMDMASVNAILGGGDPSYMPLLPSGFAILPDGPTTGQGRGMAALADSGGTLLTVALKVLVQSNPDAKPSLESINVTNSLLNSTIEKIRRALVPKPS